MSRSLLVAAVFACVIPLQCAEARGPLGRWLRGQRVQRVQRVQKAPNVQSVPTVQPSMSMSMSMSMSNVSRYGSTSEPTLFGMGIGVGSYPPYNYPRPGQFNPYRFDSYIYDPYRSGSFEPPDLLNDPYFRERHRYDSRFPGRRYRQ